MTSVVHYMHPCMSEVRLHLQNQQLWHKFSEHTTEMIITKSGRRMFPALKLSMEGLEPESRYFVILEARLAEEKRYKFSGGHWSAVGPADPQPPLHFYTHPDSPMLGSAWMAQDVHFHKVKLTNNTLDRSGNLVLTSMHKYMLHIHVVKASDFSLVDWGPSIVFNFPETEFVAVTAYQNEKITELKINNNPFAKAFRENGQAWTKRKLQAKQLKDKKQSEDGSNDRSSPVNDLKEDRTSGSVSPRRNSTEKDSPKSQGVSKASVKMEDDSGISVGSVTPPTDELVGRLAMLPPPPYYSPALWPTMYPAYLPYPGGFFLPGYQASYFPAHLPRLDLLPMDYSTKR